MLLPDDVAATTESTAQFPFNNPGHLLLAGIRCQEPPNNPTSDDQLASSASAPLNTMTVTWDRVKLATTSDHDMIQLISTIESGFPQFKHQLPSNLREYHQFCDHLYTIDGVVMYKESDLHQGVTSMRARARRVDSILARYHSCYHSSTSQLPPLQPHGSLSAQRPTIPTRTTSLFLSMHLCRFLPLHGRTVPCNS